MNWNFVSIVAISAVCTFTSAVQAEGEPSQRAVLSSPAGRFVFGQVSDYRRDKFLLDTGSGRMWNYVCAMFDKDNPKECAAYALQAVPYVDENSRVSTTPPPSK